MSTYDTATSTPDAVSPKQADAAVFEDSRSETSTVDTEDDAKIDLNTLTFFTRVYELPVVSDTLSSIYKIAESNRYTSSIISYAEKIGGFAEKSKPLLKPVEKPLVVPRWICDALAGADREQVPDCCQADERGH
ncbi:hypothetical protein DL89DRAFT_165439 [Linderina pennispora]|uniref:Uncharacterized protein n=1 Tax=Linderina pennispora TaxID=61395 RepID=A0A1Y1W899_9FUNG|nr:uncharacterized protein DL89DRAFT_165439 [Linderina pennispora]ORX69747.1 hypothetical protein DL89DRAFT_165439 [Linderina pennispora]